MSEEQPIEKKSKLRRNLIALGVALALTAVFAYVRGFGFDRPAKTNLSALCDGFFVSGVLVGGVGAMLWVSTTGFFDILAYGVKNLAALVPFHHRRKYQHYYDYKAEQDAKRQKPQYFLLVIGLLMIVLSCLTLVFLYA